MKPSSYRLRLLFRRDSVLALAAAFAIFLLVTLVVHYFVFVHGDADPFSIDDWRGLSAGLWTNAIFGALVGFISVLITLFRPEEDSLDRRLGYLYPLSNTLSPEARARLTDSVMKLAAPAVKAELHYILERHDPTLDAYWIDGHESFTLKNILRDEEYVDPRVEVMLQPDDVGPSAVELGRLHEVSLIANSKKTVLLRGKSISHTQKSHRSFVELRVPPGAEAIHSHHFSAWSKAGIAWDFYPQRFMDNLSLKVSNQTGAAIKCTVSKASANPLVPPIPLSEKRLNHGDSIEICRDLSLQAVVELLQIRFAND